LAEDYQQGALVLADPSHALWTGAFKPWSYDQWWTFDYQQASARQDLNRILRMPLAPEQVVDAAGLPLPREPHPLRLNLEAPAEPDGDYHLALTTAEGAPPPHILAILPGRPALYLAEHSLFSGPPSEALGRDLRKSIPAAALETTAGVRFLQASGVPFPKHLQERIRTCPVKVAIKCDLKPAYLGSRHENIEVRVSASGPGLDEIFSSHGWQAEIDSRPKKSGPSNRHELILHDRSAQAHFPGLLAPLGLKWDGYPATWRLRLNKTTPELFATWLKTVPSEIDVLLDKELASLRDTPISGSVSLDIAEAGIDWFDLSVALDVGDIELTPEEIKLLLNAKGGYVRLGAKGWRRLQFNLTAEEDEQLARLGLNPRDFSGEPQRFHALQLADEAASRFLGPDRAATIQQRASELKTRVTPPLPECIRAELRPYQTDGFHFLAYLSENRFGGVLADDMGLGKTLQTLAWLAWMRAGTGGPQPSLVVCPKSVMDNWRAEAERFYPELRVRTWHGEPDEELLAARKSADLIVMNYSQLRSLSPATLALPWFAAILDEAQYIKNPDSQTAQAARTLKASHRLALTGTPIENRLLDLWSIFGFAMPGVLGNRSYFLRLFDAKNDPLARRRLAARVRPFLLRRTKTQVAKDLPDRVEEDLFCEMEGVQQKLYRAELKRAQQILLKLKTDRQLDKERFNILTSLLRLRQICCHPALLDPAKTNAESAKLSALEDLLEPLMEEGHKVLVFSQFVTMLDLLQKRMRERAWPSFYLAGSTENRGDLVREFQSAQGSAVFLISLKAGGFGLNLTAASYVVLFDPWWNPAVENQAIDRTHRIGQANKVMAYRLLMRDSIEQKIRTLQKQKAALADDVLGEERFAQSLTLNDLQFLFEDA
jgi:superfamily II DNA or RNA helicase